jgi:integrase
MARVWIYDRNRDESYVEKAQKAKTVGRTPPGRWRVFYYDRIGKMRSEVHHNKAKAETRRTELETELLAGSWVDPVTAKVPLGDIAEKWIEARHNVKPTTWWKYRRLLDNHVLPEWGDRSLDAVTGEDIDVWIGRLLKTKKDGGSRLGPSQARHAYRVLSMVLGWCVPERLPRNPAAKTTLPIPPEAEHIYLTYREVEALAEASGKLHTKYDRPTASSKINRVFMLVLAYTGLRWGEAAALGRQRVDLEKRRLRIATTFYGISGVQSEGLPKTGKRRTVPIPPSLVPDLQKSHGGVG